MTLDEAKEHLSDCTASDGRLYSLGWYLSWDVGDLCAVLDGEFTPNDLEAIAIYMRALNSPL